MIKCLEYGDEFSYGRKICCCKSFYFGMIFKDKKIDHKWNCITNITNYNPFESLIPEISETNIVEDEKPVHYNWNCETPIIVKKQKDIEMKDYIIIYE